MTQGSVCIVQLSAEDEGMESGVKQRELGCPGQLCESRATPKDLLWAQVSLNNGNLRPLFWNVMEKK